MKYFLKITVMLFVLLIIVGCGSGGDGDGAGNVISPDQNTTTSDTTPPVITLNGEATITLTVGDTYAEQGATALDDVDGNVAVKRSGKVDTTTAGSYTVTYSATDSSGNSATAQRVVIVETAPQSQTLWYQPKVDTTWQWQLQGTINKSYDVDVYDIDLFDTSASTISDLHTDGRKVICYFSAGSYEAWRDDAGDFPTEALGSKMDGWDERWIDIRNTTVRSIMTARMDLAKSKGCDGVEPDNVDGYDNNNGFNLTYNDQKDYNTFLAQSAHDRGLAIGLKNDVEQVSDLEPYFDFSVNEECHQYDECDDLAIFITNDKPVFNAEYDKKYENSTILQVLCADATSRKFQTLYLPLDLDDSFRHTCTK
jgi:hypothetical protein